MIGAFSRSAVAIALFTLLVALRVKTHFPPLPAPLAIELALDRGEAGRSDPVIVAGRFGAGDFLSVRFKDAQTIEFLYDSWGVPGIVSQPVKITDGERLRLSVDLPMLNQVQGRFPPPVKHVRVECNGTLVLDAAGRFYIREPDRIYFGENPLGGTACGPILRGRIFGHDGRVLRGEPDKLFSFRERFTDWLRNAPHQALLLGLLGVGVAVLVHRYSLAFVRLARVVGRHGWFVGSATLATLLFAWLVTLGTFDFTRGEIFGSFYDYQAASLLQGRLDVPEDAIGGEAFEARGKLYGYFGPTPAILRVPFVLAGFAFGRLSRAYMLGYFVACLIAAYLILLQALRLLRHRTGETEPGMPGAFSTVGLVASVGLGSTIFFLGSRGFIFHEAILSGITFALWAIWCTLRYLESPDSRWWMGALACGVLSVHSRPPTGLFALTVLGCVAAWLAWNKLRLKQWRLSRATMRHLTIGAWCVAGFLTLNGLAWLKFRTFDAAPLSISRPYTDPGRLERIEGKSFHLVNVPFNFDTYLLRPNFHLEPGFPWIYLGSTKPRRDFPKAKIDLPDFTLSLPFAMPSLFFLATAGCGWVALKVPPSRVPLALLWLAVLPMTLALLAAIATAQRYTGDFCPFLISAAAFALAGIDGMSGAWRRIGMTAAAGLSTAAVAVTFALTIHYQGETLWGVPEETRRNYQTLRRRIDTWFGREVAPMKSPPQPRTHVDR